MLFFDVMFFTRQCSYTYVCREIWHESRGKFTAESNSEKIVLNKLTFIKVINEYQRHVFMDHDVVVANTDNGSTYR